MQAKFSMRSPAVKRLMREAEELRECTSEYSAQPLDDNLFEWHFTFRGPVDSEFEEGFYHGRIILPPEYPMRPPSIIMLTPNGRFETSRKICLSISGHHPESWQPSWSIRTALLAIIGFMPTPGRGAIGSLDYPPDERKLFAKKSQKWKCPSCGLIRCLVLSRSADRKSEETSDVKKLASQIVLKGEETAQKSNNDLNPSEESSSLLDEPEHKEPTVTEEETLPTPRVREITPRVAEMQEARTSWGYGYHFTIIVLGVVIALLLLRRILFRGYLPELNEEL